MSGAAAAWRRKGLADASNEEATKGSPRSATAAGTDKSGYSGARGPEGPERSKAESKGAMGHAITSLIPRLKPSVDDLIHL